MTEIEQKASNMFLKMLNSCNIEYSIAKKNDYNGDNRYYVSLKSKDGEYSHIWFSKDDNNYLRSSKFDNIYVKFDDGDDIRVLPKILIDFFMLCGYNKIMATVKTTNEDVCIFNIPSYRSIYELCVKLDLQLGIGE